LRRDVSRSLAATRPQLARMRSLCAGTDFDRRSASVSAWSVGAQLSHMRHPYFGGLTPAEWLRFIPVHHHHHLKIVRDILAKAG
jgi:hypothetical protein